MNRPARSRPQLALLKFAPFRLNRLAAEVSSHLSEIYRQRFGLEIPEWRVLAAVGQTDSCTAQQIVRSTRTHKTRISRAIASLEARGLVERASNSDDRRELELKLSASGRRIYAQLVPLALKRERELLSCLSKAELKGFMTALDRLEEFLELKSDGIAAEE